MQEKFTADGSKCDEDYFWIILITISRSNAPEQVAYTTILDKKEMTITLDNIQDNEWLKINPGTIGFYRSKYSCNMLRKFIPAIKNMTMPPLDRLGLLDDLFAMVQAGQTPTVEALKLIDAYRNETNYTVWSSITNSLTKLQVLLSHTNLLDKFCSYGIRLYQPVADHLGWDMKKGENHLDTLLRGLVLTRLVSFNCQKTIAEAKKRFEEHISGTAMLPADLRPACYKAVLQDADENTFKQMLKLYRTSDLHEEKDRISRALGSIKNVEILKKVVDFAMSEEVRAQDAIFVIVAVAINPKGRDMTWEFFKSDWKKLQEQYQGGFLLARLIKYLTENFASEDKAIEVEEFFAKHEFPGTERTILQSIETIRLNASWLKRDLDTTAEYLSSQ